MARGAGARTSPPQVPGFGARQGALRLIGAVLDRGAMLDESALSGDPAVRAEARGLADLTLRRLGQIDDALARFVDRMPTPPVAHVLRVMAAELLFAGTAPHAAVDIAVRLAKRGKGAGRLGGLVNAVGRRLAEQGPAILAQQDSARLNTPDWLWQPFESDWGAEAAQAIAEAHLTPAPHDLTLRSPADGPALAGEISARLLPTDTLRLDGRPQISALPGYKTGAWWAQDAAAALPARLLGDVAGRRVLDVCAAPGGKTLQLAAMGAEVMALDISARRMERLQQNLERSGLTAEIVVADALEWAPTQTFDAVLIDAPCSATGTLRRHPDLAHRRDAIDLESLFILQRRLLDRAAAWVAPGGLLIFSTCSLFRAEGEDQAVAFLDRNPGFTRVPIDASTEEIPSGLIDPQGDLRTRPDLWAEIGGSDGFFAARFRKD